MAGAALLTLMLTLLSACVSDFGRGPAPSRMPEQPGIATQPPPGGPQVGEIVPLTPPHMAGRAPIRIALLLPLSAAQPAARETAEGMLNAAQLALFDFNNPDLLLIPKDTAGRPEQAAAVAADALREGADLILGPLLGPSVQAVAPLARAQGVPVIAFSTDVSVAGNGVYLLSFLPTQDVERIVDYAVLQNITVFAGLIPDGEYGARVTDAFRSAIQNRGVTLYGIETYPPVAEMMFDPARRLALYDERHYALRSSAGDADGEGKKNSNPPLSNVPYQAVFLPDGGTQLKSIAPLLPYFDVDPRNVRFLGTGLWDDPALGREPSLVGGWFAAPAPEAHAAFAARFQRLFGAAPPRISSLAYDAVALAAALAREAPAHETPATRFSAQTLTNSDGFAGVDGVFRFLANGQNERGLAVMEMRPSGPQVIDPAPTSFQRVAPPS